MPLWFPVIVADLLRENGITLAPDHELFDDRRRVKTEAEIAGIRRAQRAAEAGMGAARDMLRAPSANGSLSLDGEPLTVERIKVAIRQAFTDHGMSSDDFIVSHGPQGASGHDLGSGPIAPGEPVVIDLWPKDPESGLLRGHDPDVRRRDAARRDRRVAPARQGGARPLPRGDQARRPRRARSSTSSASSSRSTGSRRPYEGARQAAREGLLPRTRARGRARGARGALHGPRLAPASCVAGDVVTLEPGLYRQGFGGFRLEDLVLVTEDGDENLTEFPYDLEP